MTLEDEALRGQQIGEGHATAPKKLSPWRWVARLVLVAFLAVMFGFSLRLAPFPTTVFMFVFLFIGLVFLGGKVVELHRAVTALGARLGPKTEDEGKEKG